MQLDIAHKIYDNRYYASMDFDKYLSILENGFKLLKEKATKRRCDKSEREAMKFALEYNLEQMFS